MSDFEAMVNAHLGAAQRKQQDLNDAAQRKQDYLDPVFEFGVDDVEILDQDTVRLPSGESLRLSGGQGRTLDAYETDASRYADRPETFERHKRNYARAYGLDPNDVTVDDLVIAGQSQKAKAGERLRSMADENGRIRYRQRGQDDYGRTVAEVDPQQVNLSGRQDNADYYSKFNYEQTLEDFASGERAEQNRGAGGRSLKTGAKDQVVNFVAGAGRMANDLVQGAGTLVGINNIPGVDEGHRAVRDALDSFKEWGNSPQQQRRERLEQERNELQSEFYNVQREKYLKDGNSELHSSIRAGIDEFTNAVGNMIDNPGAILDKTVESLPYMLGVASVGKKATTKAIEAVQKNILKNVGVQKNITRGLEKTKGIKGTKGRFQSKADLEATAAFHTQQFINSKAGQAYLKKVQTISGVTTVGLTEGLSTSADVYDSIANMTEEQAANSEKYLEYRRKGMSHEKATEKLAEDAHLQTLLTVTLAAGAASWITGAGTFEAQLFTGLRGVSKTAANAAKEAAKQPTKKGVVKALAGATYRGTKAAVKHVGPGTAKEGAEELLQSGGGEFLSQLASFEATGEQVGPGVGRAAGEGFVVGAASGGLAEISFGSLRKLAAQDPEKLLKSMNSYKDKVKGKAEIRQARTAAENAVSGTVTTPEKGQPAPTPPQPTEQVDADPVKAFDTELDSGDTNPINTYKQLKKIADRAQATGKPLTEKQEKILQAFHTSSKNILGLSVVEINQKKAEDITPQDLAILQEAASIGVENIDTSNLSEAQRTLVENETQLSEDVEAAQTTAAEIKASTPADQQTAVQRVHDEKFGDVITKRGQSEYPGLGYYNRRMRELMNVLSPSNAGTEENKELDSLIRRLKNFTGSQNRYLAAVRQAIRTKSNAPIEGTNKEVVYTEPTSENKGGTQGLERLLMKEDEQFNKIRDGLIKRYRQWEAAGQASQQTVRSSANRQANREARQAKQTEQQTRREAAREREQTSEVESDLREERLKIKRDFPDETSLDRRSALINLIKRARKTGDTWLVDHLVIDLRTVNARRKAAAKKNKTEATFAEDVPIGRGRARKNTFTPSNTEEEVPITTPPEEKTLRMHLVDNNLREALNWIKGHKTSGGLGPLAARIAEVLGERNVDVVMLTAEEFGAQFGNPRASGAYANNKIYLNMGRIKSGLKLRNTLLHEAIHAAINGAIKENKIPAELKERLRDLNNNVIRALNATGEDTAIALAGILSRNPEELLTHGIGTPYLQNFLRNHKVGQQSMWDKFVELVADLLGVPKGSALGEVLAITEEIFQSQAPAQAEANSEGADAAPRAADATEQVAEAGAPASTAALEAKAAQNRKARRLGEAKRLQTLFANNRIQPDQAYLTHAEDRAMLERLLSEGVPAVQAIEQVLDAIEPNPQARNVVEEPSVPQEVIDQAALNGAQLNSTDAKPVSASSILGQLWNYVAGLADAAAAAVQKLFVGERNLGVTASNSWELRSSKVRDLLASDDQIMDILTDPASREQFFDKVGTTPAEERALRTFANFYTRFAQVLNDTMEEERPVSLAAANQAAQNPLYFFRDQATGKIHQNVAAAMALEALQYLVGSGAQSIRNTDDDIRAILGISEFAMVDPLARQVLGRGTLQRNMTQEVGRKAFAHLNLKLKTEARPLGQEVLEAAMGSQILGVLTQLGTIKKQNGRTDPKGTLIGRVERIRISPALWKQLKDLHAEEGPSAKLNRQVDDSLDAEGDIILVTNKLDDSDINPETGQYDEIDVNAKMRRQIEEGRDIFQKLFSSTATVRTPMFRKPNINDIPKKVYRSLSKIPQAMRDRMLHDAQNHWQADTELLDLIEKFGSDEESAVDAYLRLVHGGPDGFLTEAEIEKLHDEVRDGAIGRNRGLRRDLEEALRWNSQYGDRKFYLPMKMTKNGRLMIDSNVINPQANKLHRFLFVRDQWSREVTKGALSQAEYSALMTAIGLGMGIKTEYTPIAEVVRQVEEAFNDPNSDWSQAMRVLQNAGDGAFTADQKATLAKVLSKENTHTFAALNAAAKWFGAKDGAKVTISLPHETDGVTNGYIIGLLITPPAFMSPEYRKLLNAGGIYFEGDPWKSLAEYKAEGNLDNYQHIAQDTGTNLANNKAEAKAVDDKVITQYANARKISDRRPGATILIRRATDWVAASGLVPSAAQLAQNGLTEAEQSASKEGRKWAKNPLMVMSYGAGWASVGRQIVSNAIEKFYVELGKAANPEGREATAEDIAVALNRAFRIINMVAMANNRVNVPNIVTDEQGETQFLKYRMQLTDGKRHTITAQDVQILADTEFGGSLQLLGQKFKLNKMQVDLLRQGLNATYGAAMQEAMNTRLEPVLKVRGRMNMANQFANMMYVGEYERQIQALRDAGVIVTSRHKQQVQEKLMAQGLVPTISTAESTGIEDSLEMTSYGSEYLKVQKNLLAGVGLFNKKYRLAHKYWGLNGQQREPEATSSITGRITTRVPDSDVGVAAVVKSIHALDGVINSLVWGQGRYPVLNVHDAQVSPWFAATDIAKSANVAFGETLAGYDLPDQFKTMLERIAGSLWNANDSRLSQEVKDEIAVAMGVVEQAFHILETPPPETEDAKAYGYAVIEQLRAEVATDQESSLRSKGDLFGAVRSINQFAQQGTEIPAPSGINLNEPTAWAGNLSVTQSVEDVLLDESNNNMDVQFAEDFENQLESEKILSTWEGLAEWETHADIDVGHQNHLRTVVRDIVRPGLETVEPIIQEVLAKEGTDGHQAVWDGDILRLKTAGAVLTSNADTTLQERAAQEYVYNIVDYGVNEDHFIRKELGRLFDLAKENLSVGSFLPADIVGDPQIARERAQERYDYIFNNTDANEAYKRFLSIGLTNKPMIEALSRIDNQDAPVVSAPDWSKGILRGMMSVFRQILQKVAGTSQRYNGGTVSDALTALAKGTVAVNQRNQQRLKDLRTGVDGTSRVQRINERLVQAVNDRFVDPLAKGLEARHRKSLDPKNPTLPGFIKAATYAALKTRDDEVRDHYNRFYRELTNPHGVGKDNWVFQTVAEVTPWPDDQLSWIGLLRKSKYIVDMARQEVNDHTRSFINSSFDKNNYMSKAHKMAMTNVLLKTDISSLIASEQVNMSRLAELLADPNARQQETARLETRLRQELAAQGVDPKVFFLFQNQARSLANFMVNGETTVENGMLNAYNIVNQFMLDELDRVKLKDVPAMESIVDRLASIYALNQQTANDLRLTNDIVQHEMSREENGDNGFSRLIGMHINFKELAKQNLFDGQPIQMIKGYVYEIFDGDVNIEYVEQGSDREQELIADGMQLVGELPKDSHDLYKGKRLLYKGLKGLNTYNKSIVSLTDLQHRGANLFSTNGYQSQTSLANLGFTRSSSYATATRQFQPNFRKPGVSMVPVLNNAGKIVDYRYMMSESNKRKILKKEDPFDRVLPRMFASISDRNNTEVINQDVVNLLKQEWVAGRNNPAQRFIRIARDSTDQQGRDMWNLLPESMQRAARKAFGGEQIFVRDEVVNLVLGFRKATISNIKKPGEEGGIIWGKGTPVVRMAEKVWLEIVQLMRVKIAILTPAVVVGNIASNTAMLLSEGIPLNYIRKGASEAISSMRQYQKDQKAATELMRLIGSRQALGQDTRALEVRLARLNADLNANPVAELVRDGLFTSITADLGVDDDTIRGSMIQKAEDALGNKGGRAGKAAAHVVKEAYMLPGSKGYQAAVAATQYGDFVGRYIKFKYDTQVNKKDREAAINDALAAFIYYDIPQPKYLQALNDSGLVMFTKFFLRIQHIVARMYSQNPVSAFSVLALQKSFLADPFNENIMNYGMGDGLTNKFSNPLNLPGKAWSTLNPTEPALLQWILNPFGL